MLKPDITHYAPWDQNDEGEPEFAVCGARVTHDLTHSTQPTCSVCVAYLVAEDLREEIAAALDAGVTVTVLALEGGR